MTLEKAYTTSGKIFAQVSQKASPAMYEQLKAITPGEIVVVQGQHDHIEKLLPNIGITFELISPEKISSHNGGKVMLVNCMTYDNAPKRTKAIDQFVEEGGRLVTTDWAVSLISYVFPGRLKKTVDTVDDVVEIRCDTDMARRLIGLNYSQCHPKWWLEGSSHIYSIGQGVTPLITSEEMRERYGQPYVAVGFPIGKGEVIHFISHLELQRTKQKTKSDKAGLEEFLEKMGASKTAGMDDETNVAELEAAYSTLNTLAYLCIPMPIIPTTMKSITIADLTGNGKSVAKSKKLA